MLSAGLVLIYVNKFTLNKIKAETTDSGKHKDKLEIELTVT